jgi:uncharacterized protein YuzE
MHPDRMGKSRWVKLTPWYYTRKGKAARAAAEQLAVEYDLDADAAYLRLTAKPVYRTVEVSDDVLADLDSSGGVVGIELLNPPRTSPDPSGDPGLTQSPRAG